jgi:hypothetical protein
MRPTVPIAWRVGVHGYVLDSLSISQLLIRESEDFPIPEEQRTRLSQNSPHHG